MGDPVLQIRLLLGGGLLASLLGGSIVTASGWVAIGTWLLAIGSACLFCGLVGVGVNVGTQAALAANDTRRIEFRAEVQRIMDEEDS